MTRLGYFSVIFVEISVNSKRTELSFGAKLSFVTALTWTLLLPV